MALDNIDRKTKRFQSTLKQKPNPKNRPASQFQNFSGPQMPLLLVTQSMCHLCSYHQNFACTDQSSPCWTKMSQVCIYNDFLKNAYQGFSLLAFLLDRQPSPIKFTVTFFFSLHTSQEAEAWWVLPEQPSLRSPRSSLDRPTLSISPLATLQRPIQAELLTSARRAVHPTKGHGRVHPNLFPSTALPASTQFG